MAVIPAAHAASVVFVATPPIPTKSIAESVLPGLKEHRESDLHTENEKRRDQCPGGVDRVDNVIAFQHGIRALGVGAKAEQTGIHEHECRE
jgi:hypothetical protein